MANQKYPINDVPKRVIQEAVSNAQRKRHATVESILIGILDTSVADAANHLDLETGEARVIDTPEIVALRDRISYQIGQLQK